MIAVDKTTAQEIAAFGIEWWISSLLWEWIIRLRWADQNEFSSAREIRNWGVHDCYQKRQRLQMTLSPWLLNEECLKRMEELSWSQDRKNALKKEEKRKRKNRKVANLVFGYVFLPLAVCFFVLILKLFLLSSVSFKFMETWIFQTLLDHWLECCLLSVINLNFLIRFNRNKN